MNESEKIESREIEGVVTVDKVFGDFGARVKREIAEGIKGRKKDKKRRLLWWLAASRINAKVDELMDLPIGGALGENYVKLQEIRRQARKMQKHAKDYRAATPENPFPLPLNLKHTITLEPEYTVKVDVDRWEVGKLDFKIKMRFAFTKATVGVAGGCLHSATLGVCTFSGEFKCTIDDEKSPAVDVRLPPPGEKIQLKIGRSIPFNPPIRILPDSLQSESVPASEPARSTATTGFDPQRG